MLNLVFTRLFAPFRTPRPTDSTGAAERWVFHIHEPSYCSDCDNNSDDSKAFYQTVESNPTN